MDSPGPSNPSMPTASGNANQTVATTTTTTTTSQTASSGSLRTKISLRGLNLTSGSSSLICPFYLMKPELPSTSPLLGSMNLLAHFGMNAAYSKFCGPKKLREELSAFLPHLPGNIDAPVIQNSNSRDQSGSISSIMALVEKPPIIGKEIAPLSSTALAGFRLNPGPVAEKFRLFGPISTTASNSPNSNALIAAKKKHKKKHKRSLDDTEREDIDGDRKWKRQKKDDDKEKRRKRKKEKKKKKVSPQPPMTS